MCLDTSELLAVYCVSNVLRCVPLDYSWHDLETSSVPEAWQDFSPVPLSKKIYKVFNRWLIG
jgi:hypothetical protein